MTVPAQELFDAEARRYDASFDQPGPAGYSLRTRLAATLRLVPDEPGDVLDAGMGPGRLCVELDQLGWRVSGVDVSEVMVEMAAARLPHARERLLAASIEALPFPDESFDVVIATGVLEHVEDKGAAIRELARVLRPDGRAIVSFPNPHSFYFWWKSGVSYRLSTILKRRVETSRAQHPGAAGAPLIEAVKTLDLGARLGEAGLAVDHTEPVAFLAVPSPLDTWFPKLSTRLGAALERRRTGARRFATQTVTEARKTAQAV